MSESKQQYAYLQNLMSDTDAIEKLQMNSIFHNDHFNAMILSIPKGQTLKEHKAPRAITLQVLEGSGTMTVNGNQHPIQRGSWLYVEPNVEHAIESEKTLVILLSLFDLSAA